jgi:hypothetical protein
MSDEKPSAESPARLLAELVVILDGIDHALPSARRREKEMIQQALARLRATLAPAPGSRTTVRDMREALEHLGLTVVTVLGAVQGRLAEKSAEVVKHLPSLRPEKRRKIAPHNLAELHALLNKWPEVREEMLSRLPAEDRRQLAEKWPPEKGA